MKILAWVVFVWTLIRGMYFFVSPEMYEAFGELTWFLYLVYFTLVAILAFKMTKSK